jgi:hypothetical protein
VHRAGFLVKGRALADDMVAGVKARRGVHEQCYEPLLALDQRPRPEILALEIQKIEQEEDSAAALTLSNASCTILNEVMPSGPTPHNSPSR